ncbi:SixA phosphatase family protein [Psychromarinibacter sp. S121]|uniref:SixA phosphatase family protein n=1 Tax=Psychromarinibacter sp. S121 TaxID=3415127 RepID=UPI003C7D2FE3
MTLRLILTRHAKSSWDDPELSDHARTLNKRGKRAAEAVGGWLAEKGYLPDLVLSSDAIRTQETWERMKGHLPPPGRIEWTPALYLAGPGAILKALRGAKGARNVLLLAHNPGISQFASAIVAIPPQHKRFHDYPTCATLVADFDADGWNELAPGMGSVVDFTAPADLEG